MRYLVYAMIGAGFQLATPYQNLPLGQKFVLGIAWPAFVTRDIINEFAGLSALQNSGGGE